MNTDKNWKAVAEGSGLRIPPEQLERIAGALDSLEAAFRPLLKDLPPELEPATVMRLEDGE